MIFKKIALYHYEIQCESDDVNELMKTIESIPDEDCHIEINGNSYHFSNKESRIYFVIGIDLAFQLEFEKEKDLKRRKNGY